MDNNEPPALPPDAPDKEKMDQIRNKRLAKLGGSVTSKTGEQNNPSSSSASPTPNSPLANPTISPTDKTSSTPKTENPFSQLRISAPTSSPNPVVQPSPTTGGGKRGIEASDSQKAQKRVSKEESSEAFENRTLSNIFRMTLDPDRTIDAAGNKLAFLPGVKQELDESNEPVRLSVANLEQAIVEAASKSPPNKPLLDYLLPCWKRVIKAAGNLKGNAKPREATAIIKEAKRLCMSYCIFAVVLPDLFNRENPDSLLPHLLAGSDDEKGLCHEFLAELVSRFADDDAAKLMIVNTVTEMSAQLSSLSMNDNYTQYVLALKLLVNFPAIVTAIAESPHFQMALSASAIEKTTILGPYFRLSPLQPEVVETFFPGARTIEKNLVIRSQSALRMSLETLQKDLCYIVNAFIKAGEVPRGRMLDWFAYALNQNHKRRAMRVDEKTVSSDGFMMNITVALDVLCEPFMDSTFSKVDRIDFDYLRRKPRLDIKEETKLNADQNSSDEFYASEVGGKSNFISEVFFLCLAAHHYGSEGMHSKLKSLDRDIKHFEKTLDQIEGEREKLANSPWHLQQYQLTVQKYTDILQKSIGLKYTIQGVLFDNSMQSRSLLFMRYVIVWLLRIASGGEYIPGQPIKLPLSPEIPEKFRVLPEYVLDVVVSNFKFTFRMMPQIVSTTQIDELIALCITFLTNSEYIKNPYLKSELVTILYHGTWPQYGRQKGVLGDTLSNDKFANDYLLHALMKWYIECESTGTHTQFYDKFNIRYEIFQVIKCVWTNDVYRQRLKQESKTNTEFFIKFVNLLLNDATYVLDEALTKFPKIHELETALKDRSLSAEERAKKEEALQTASDQAKNYMNLTNETVEMMKLFTSALSDAFTMPEVVTRLADMLDYNLDLLVGPRASELNVDNRDKYKFVPKMMINDFVEIYLNLGKSESFIEAVARDARSYKPANFGKATIILTRHALRSTEEFSAWATLLDKIRMAKELDDQAEEDLGPIPEEFEDPLMATLMEDPVILPTSGQTVDRSTIRSHLLSDPKDPFNRQPLVISDVIENVELKARIAAFKAERKAAAKKAIAERQDDAMDTSE